MPPPVRLNPNGASPRAPASSTDAAPRIAWLAATVRWTWKIRMLPQLESEIEQRLRDEAEAEAIRVFGRNLHDLLLAAPAGQRTTMGLDPGIRTGVKVAVVDGTGKLLDTAVIYPHEPRKDWDGALRTLAQLCATHRVELVSIGNGTASRETDKLVADLMSRHADLRLTRVVVSEAGASVYSASELAANEFPALDVSLRGAVSIARRLQDPLAELVRIDPKAIGVGQYQHDVSPTRLARKLDAIVEDCVNAVGADVNTASVPLLARISGLSESIAKHIVSFRDEHGPFRDRMRDPEGAAGRRADVRAGRRLSAHHGWRQPARPIGRASGGVSDRRAHRRADRSRRARADGEDDGAAGGEAGGVRRRRSSACRR